MSPEKILIKKDDGTEEEREYYTAEDLEKKVGETKAEMDARMKEMESEANPNWKEARRVMSEQDKKIKALEAQGKTINDAGQIVDLDQKVSYEEVEKRARAAARSEQLNFKKEELLSRYDEETRKVVEHNFNKLAAGEELNVSNMSQFIDQAEILSVPGSRNAVRQAVTAGRGTVPNKSEVPEYGDTDDGKEAASMLGLQYATKK